MEIQDDRGSGRVWSGILLVVAVVFTVLGGASLAILDARQAVPTEAPVSLATAALDSSPTSTAESDSLPTSTATTEPVIVSLPSPDIQSTEPPLVVPSATSEPEVSSTPEPILERCEPPSDWVPYTVRLGDTLFSLSTQGGVTVDVVKAANCLPSDALYPGNVLYLPSAPPQPVPGCGPPFDWVFYTVQPGDTLFSLATRSGVSVSDVVFANCLPSTSISTGRRLYLPSLPSAPPLQPVVSPSPSPLQPSGNFCLITSPADGSQVSGQVTFVGSATAEQFLFYKLEANGPQTGGIWASLLGSVVSTPVTGGGLGTTNLGGWEPGTYSIRLVVVDVTSNEVARCNLGLEVISP